MLLTSTAVTYDTTDVCECMFSPGVAIVLGGFLLAHSIITWSLVEDSTSISDVTLAHSHIFPAILASRKSQHGYWYTQDAHSHFQHWRNTPLHIGG